MKIIKKNLYQMRLLVCFIAIVIVIVILLSTIVFFEVRNASNNFLIHSNMNTTIQIKDSTEVLLKEVDHSLTQLGYAPSVVDFADRYNILTYQDTQNVIDNIDALISSNPYILSCYIYYINTEKVLDSANYYHLVDINMDDQKELIKQVYSLSKKEKELSTIHIFNIKSVHNDSTLVFEKSIPSYSQTAKALLIVVLDPSYFSDIFNSINTAKGSNIYIVDKSGALISQVNANMPEIKVILSRVQFKNILDESSGSFVDTKSKNLVTFVTSNSLGWKYINCVPLADINESISQVTPIIWVIAFLCVALGIILAHILAWKLSVPIRKMSSLIYQGESNSLPLPNDDIVYIEENLNRLIHQNKNLEATIRESMPILKQSFLRRIIYEEISKDADIWERFRYYDIHIRPDNFYLIFVIQVDPLEMQRYTEKQFSMLNIYQVNLVNDFFSADQIGVETLNIGSDKLYVFLSSPKTKTSIQEAGKDIFECVKTFYKQITNYFKFSTTIGMSNICDDVTNLRTLFNEAKTALEYKAIIGCSQVIRFSDVPVVAELNYNVLHKQEDAICDFLKHGQKTELFHALNDYFSYLSLNSNSFKNLRYLYANFLHTTIECLLSMAIDIDNISGNENLYKKLLDLDTTQKVQLWFVELYTTIFEFIDTARNNKKKENLSLIKSFIVSNYDDPELSLNLIADHMGFSVSYMTKLFSDLEFTSIKGYITELRMKKAMGLLENSTMKVKDISFQVGYCNERSFLVSFKRIMGETPGQYRNRRFKRGLPMIEHHEESIPK